MFLKTPVFFTSSTAFTSFMSRIEKPPSLPRHGHPHRGFRVMDYLAAHVDGDARRGSRRAGGGCRKNVAKARIRPAVDNVMCAPVTSPHPVSRLMTKGSQPALE
ncbi:MAG TPA: hypothetical protein VFV98_03455 [Vicinamibacterales bacterium]|nr:hypothetical protein [Vicinamibacterales bacterium]